MSEKTESYVPSEWDRIIDLAFKADEERHTSSTEGDEKQPIQNASPWDSRGYGPTEAPGSEGEEVPRGTSSREDADEDDVGSIPSTDLPSEDDRLQHPDQPLSSETAPYRSKPTPPLSKDQAGHQFGGTANRAPIQNYNPSHDEHGRFAPAFSGRSGTEAKYKHGGSYDADRVASVHEPAIRDMLDKPKAAGSPTLYMTGGGYGSGKSTLLEKFPEIVGFPAKSKAVVADPDALKKAIPEYQKLASGDHPNKQAASIVHEESSHLAKEGVRRGLLGGHDVIYDTSGDTSIDKLHEKVQEMRSQGAARVEANYAFPGSIKEAQVRADQRAAASDGGLRRFVPPVVLEANHKLVSKVWLGMAERQTFDKLTLWSTAGKFGDPPTPVATAAGGRITVHDRKAFDEFKRIGGVAGRVRGEE